MSAADDADRELLFRLKLLLLKLSRGYRPTPNEMKGLQMYQERCKPTDAREN